MESERRKVYVEVNVTHRPDGSKIQSDEGSVKYESEWKMIPLTYAS